MPQYRAGMRGGRTFSGLPGLTAEDAAMTSSMGAVYDRTKEHLVPADRTVIRMRRVLLDTAHRVARGEPPLGAKTSTDVTAVRATLGPPAGRPGLAHACPRPQRRRPITMPSCGQNRSGSLNGRRPGRRNSMPPSARIRRALTSL